MIRRLFRAAAAALVLSAATVATAYAQAPAAAVPVCSGVGRYVGGRGRLIEK